MNRAHTVGRALVTRASGGIGAIYAGRLVHHSHGVMSVARGQAQLNRVARRAAGATGCKATVLSADPADFAPVQWTWRDDAAAPERLPSEIVVPVDDVANAAFGGQRGDRETHEEARQALCPGRSQAAPAGRYGAVLRACAGLRRSHLSIDRASRG